jgi:hypothetical protein
MDGRAKVLGIAVLGAAVAGALVLVGPASSQALPVVSIQGATDGQVTEEVDPCAVADDPVAVSSTPITVTFIRDQTTGPLTVAISVDPGMNPTGLDLPTEVTFADGEATTSASFSLTVLAPPGTTTTTTTISTGAGYTVGSPSSITADFVHTIEVVGGDVVQAPLDLADYDCEPIDPADPAQPESRVLARTG